MTRSDLFTVGEKEVVVCTLAMGKQLQRSTIFDGNAASSGLCSGNIKSINSFTFFRPRSAKS